MSLHISLQPSCRLTGLLIFVHAGALLCLFLSAAPLWLKIISIFICLISAWYAITKYALLSHPKAIVQCTTLENNMWRLTDHQGKEKTVCLSGDSFRSRYFLILHFKQTQQNQRVIVILLSDMLDAEILRRLQVYLTVQKTSLV